MKNKPKNKTGTVCLIDSGRLKELLTEEYESDGFMITGDYGIIMTLIEQVEKEAEKNLAKHLDQMYAETKMDDDYFEVDGYYFSRKTGNVVIIPDKMEAKK